MTKLNVLFSNKILVALVIAVALFIFGQIISPGFADFSHVMNILSLSTFLGIIALGQTIVILSGGEGIDLSVGAIVSLSAVVASQVMNSLNANMPLAILIVLAAGFLIGIVNGAGVSYLKIPPLIMTLAMASVVQGIALIYTDGQPKGKAAPALITLGSERSLGIPNILFVWIAVILVALYFLRKTSWGLRLYGTGENTLTAALSGVKTCKIRMLAYGASGCISAFGGLLLLGYTATSYLDIGSAYIMPSVAAVVIGGVSLAGGNGSYLGTSLGAVVLTTLSSILIALKMGEAGRQVVYGLVLLLLLVIYARQKKS
jgi:ribose transport system permease protein